MRIERLRLINFRQHEDTEIEFGLGLTGIIGPNGAGKTTLLEAIAWVMFGMKAARGTRDYIRRRNAPPRSRVEVDMTFSLGKHQYRVTRSLNSAELYQDGSATPIANSIETVTQRISRLLGMTRDEFFNTYFTGQKDLAVMASLRAPQRAQFLSRVLGYERIRTAQERLKETRQDLRLRVGMLESSLPDLEALATDLTVAEAAATTASQARAATESELASVTAKLATLRPEFERQRAGREERQSLESERRVLMAGLATLEERLRVAREEARESEEARQVVSDFDARLAPLASLRIELAALVAQAHAFNQQRERFAQGDSARSRLAEVTQAIERRPTTEALELVHARTVALRKESQDVADELEAARMAWVRDSADAQSNRNSLIAQFKDLETQRERIVSLGRDGACPTCSRPLGEEFERVLGVIDRQMQEVKSNGLYYKRRIDQLKAEPPEITALQRQREALARSIDELTVEQGGIQAQIAERRELTKERERLGARLTQLESEAGAEATGYDARRHDVVRAELASLEQVALQAERLRDTAARAEAREEAMQRIAREQGAAMAQLNTIGARIEALAFDPVKFAELTTAAEQGEAARHQAELQAVRARSAEEAARLAVTNTKARVAAADAHQAELKAVSLRLQLHDELDRAFNDLRTDLNQQLRPELSEIASGFLRDLTNGRYTELELNEQYEPMLLDEGDPKAVISGGEEDVANLALRLAISQMIADRAGQPLSMLVLDEIFGSLDDERRAAVLELLRGLADRFPQVIMITHVDSVRDGFDRVIRVSFDNARCVAVVKDDQGADHGLAA